MAGISLVVCFTLVLWLIRKDMAIRRFPSTALWVPALWLFILASRPVSFWLRSLGIGPGSAEERGPADQIFYFGLILVALLILINRRVNWGEFLFSNKALILIYVYLAASAVWAPSGTSVLIRLAKDFGHVLMALILLTEEDSWLAIRAVFVRLSYVILPLSLVLMKYFPAIGRVGDRRNNFMYVGVALHKNTMGVILLGLALILIADLMCFKNESNIRQMDRRIRYGMLGLAIWLLFMCQSKTSLLCLIVGYLTLWGTGRLTRLQRPGQVLARCLVLFLFLGACEVTFGISTLILEGLGRDETLTGRTFIWQAVQQAHTNWLVGVGFYSFWDTPIAKVIMEPYMVGGWILNTAHNGFLEMYLDGGILGVALLIILLLTWFQRSIKRTLTGTMLGRLALSICVVAVIHNNSETGFFRLTLIWFILLLVTIEYVKPQVIAWETSPFLQPATAALHPANRISYAANNLKSGK